MHELEERPGFLGEVRAILGLEGAQDEPQLSGVQNASLRRAEVRHIAPTRAETLLEWG